MLGPQGPGGCGQSLRKSSVTVNFWGRWYHATFRYTVHAMRPRPRQRDSDPQHMQGLLALQQGRLDEAAAHIRQAIAGGGGAEVWLALGVIAAAQGQDRLRRQAYQAAIALEPGLVRAWSNLAAAWLAADAPAAAAEAAGRALRLEPAAVGARVNRGDARRRLGWADGALADLLVALQHSPQQVEALVTLGVLLRDEGCRTEADAMFAQALALNPHMALAHWNRGLLRLGIGDLPGGWAGYGWRFATPALHQAPRWPLPPWQGEDPRELHLLVWREQGLGDELLFGSCYPDLLACAGGVTVLCDPRLAGLFGRSLPGARVVPLADLRYTTPFTLEGRFDRQVAAGSLPALLRPALTAFPVTPGWLRADPERVAVWHARLQAAALPENRPLRVGLCWRSALVEGARGHAYTRLADWAPLLRLPGIQVVVLQHDAGEALLRAQEWRCGVRLWRWPGLDLRDDLEDVAALISGLDLVITAATAVGELAAALGVPVWRVAPGEVMGGDWSGLGTAVRPWYPTQRVIELRPGERMSAIPERAAALLASLRPETGSEHRT